MSGNGPSWGDDWGEGGYYDKLRDDDFMDADFRRNWAGAKSGGASGCLLPLVALGLFIMRYILKEVKCQSRPG